MKKLLAVLLAIALIATLGITTAFAEEEPIHLTLWTFQELHTQLYKEMLDEWNANPDNPKLEIDMQVYPYEDMHNKLTIALQSGEGAPDIVDIEINMFANYLKGDIQLADLNDIVEPMKDHLVMSRFNNYAKDGKYYGIDHHIGACVMFLKRPALIIKTSRPGTIIMRPARLSLRRPENPCAHGSPRIAGAFTRW